jgi:hypothetical protein
MKKLFILIIAISFFYGCSKPIIEGEVKDSLGQPLEGVNVTIKNTRLQTITDEKGKYSIEYAPGAFTLLYSKDRYLDYEMNLNISSKDKIPAEQITLHALAELFIKKNPENAEIKITRIDLLSKMDEIDYYQGKILKPGRYQIQVSANGYISKTQQIQIELEEIKEVQIFLEPIPPIIDQDSVKGRFFYGKNEKTEFFILSGNVINESEKTFDEIKIKGTLYNKKKEEVKTEIVNCGNILADTKIENMMFDEIHTYLSKKTKCHNFEIPFMIIFSDLPENLSKFTINIEGFN